MKSILLFSPWSGNRIEKVILFAFTIAFIMFFSFVAHAEIKGHKKVNDKYISTKTGFDDCNVEIGDIQSPTFRPHIKIKKWDNDASLDLELITDEQDAQVIEDGANNKIKWVGQKKEVHFYELPADNAEKFEKGGYEFEIVLKQKPESNVMRFSMQSRNLDFYYQPALTPEEIAEGRNRPDDVVGSYAVYHITKKNNQYRTGKAFHIYRPKVFDSAGKWTWGELNINPANTELTVTIPQQFIDNAVYPVFHAAGLTFGHTSIGASNGSGNSGVMIADKAIVADGGGTLNSISFYFYFYSGNGWRAALYDGTPNAKIVNSDTAEATASGTQWQTATTGAATISAAGTYYIARQIHTGSGIYSWYDNGPAGSRVYRSFTYGAFPDNIGTTTAQSYIDSIYANYTMQNALVTPSAGTDGSISPNTPQTVNLNATTAFTLSPDTGYSISSVTGTCGGTLTGNTYTTVPITTNCTVMANFAINTYSVTPSAGANGSISPATVQTVNYNTTKAFTVTPNTGYSISSVTGTCGGTLSGTTYTTGPITSNCTVTATFAINTYTVTPSAGANGSISPTTPQTINYNNSASFTIIPNAGYIIESASGCFGGTLNGYIYTTGPVTGNCTVTATFAVDSTSPEKIAVQNDQGTTTFRVTSGGTVNAINLGGGFVPTALADNVAGNNLIYYSTTQGRLVYKDFAGVIHTLY